MYKHKRTDFIETNLKDALVESYKEQLTWLEETEMQFTKYHVRLLKVREEKEKARLELLGNFAVNSLGLI